MEDDDLLARVQRRGRLYGRNESRRAVCAVVESLGEFLSARAYRLITEQLPDEVRRRLTRPADRDAGTVATCRAFLGRLSARLHADGPDVPFLARVVFAELNVARRVITPAAFAHLVAADLRSLLCARPAGEPADVQFTAPRLVIRVPVAAVRAVPGEIRRERVPGVPVRAATPEAVPATVARTPVPEAVPATVARTATPEPVPARVPA
jgi:uncharacterized protein (DUF2267 family)